MKKEKKNFIRPTLTRAKQYLSASLPRTCGNTLSDYCRGRKDSWEKEKEGAVKKKNNETETEGDKKRRQWRGREKDGGGGRTRWRRIRRGLLVPRYPRFWETCSASLLGVPNSSLIYDWHSLPFFEGGERKIKREKEGEDRTSPREKVQLEYRRTYLDSQPRRRSYAPARSGPRCFTATKKARSPPLPFSPQHCAIINGPVRSERIRSPSIWLMVAAGVPLKRSRGSWPWYRSGICTCTSLSGKSRTIVS